MIGVKVDRDNYKYDLYQKRYTEHTYQNRLNNLERAFSKPGYDINMLGDSLVIAAGEVAWLGFDWSVTVFSDDSLGLYSLILSSSSVLAYGPYATDSAYTSYQIKNIRFNVNNDTLNAVLHMSELTKYLSNYQNGFQRFYDQTPPMYVGYRDSVLSLDSGAVFELKLWKSPRLSSDEVEFDALTESRPLHLVKLRNAGYAAAPLSVAHLRHGKYFLLQDSVLTTLDARHEAELNVQFLNSTPGIFSDTIDLYYSTGELALSIPVLGRSRIGVLQSEGLRLSMPLGETRYPFIAYQNLGDWDVRIDSVEVELTPEFYLSGEIPGVIATSAGNAINFIFHPTEERTYVRPVVTNWFDGVRSRKDTSYIIVTVGKAGVKYLANGAASISISSNGIIVTSPNRLVSEIALVSVSGQEVSVERVPGTAFFLSTASLAKGIYALRLIYADGGKEFRPIQNF